MLATFSQHRQTCTMYLLVFEQRFVAKNSTSLNLTKRSPTRVIEHSIYYSFRGLTAQQQYLLKKSYAVFTALWKRTGQQQFLDKLWRTALRGVRFLNPGSILYCRVILANSTNLPVIHCTLCSTRDDMCISGQNSSIQFNSRFAHGGHFWPHGR